MREYLTVLFLLVTHQAYAMDVVAHRGYGCFSDENSIGSIDRAWRVGADGVEIDIRVSKDGVVYLFHDEEISKRKVSELTYSELSLLSSTPISTLTQVLELAPHPGYFVFDLKVGDPSKLDKVIGVIEDSQLADASVSFQSEDLGALLHIQDRLPNSKLSYLTHLRWKIPYVIHPSAADIAKRLEGVDVHRVSIQGRSFINRKFIETLQATGREVHVWTINDPARAIYYRDIGADGVITDNVANVLAQTRVGKKGISECGSPMERRRGN